MKEYTFKSIAVYCGSNFGINPVFSRVAYNLGEILAKNGIQLIFGGSDLGLMGEVARGALEYGGAVTGVIPQFLNQKGITHQSLTGLVITRDMQDRKMKMQELSDGFIILPGGFGTMEEFFQVLAWAQLELHTKPIGVLNAAGYYDNLLNLFCTMAEEGLLKEENKELALFAETPISLLDKMNAFKPQTISKWME